MKRELLRIVDANYNRAKEAMRVCEDIMRFAISDKSLSAQWKKDRHALARIFLKLPLSYRDLVASRDSQRDVGRKSLLRDKVTKLQWEDLLIANAKRGQEAVRVLEELSKVIAPKSSISFQLLRFRLYELEKRSLQKF